VWINYVDQANALTSNHYTKQCMGVPNGSQRELGLHIRFGLLFGLTWNNYFTIATQGKGNADKMPPDKGHNIR